MAKLIGWKRISVVGLLRAWELAKKLELAKYQKRLTMTLPNDSMPQ
jgi:hypothetical protein